MYPENFQYNLEIAIARFERQFEEKPSLLKINQHDFKAILPYKDESSKFGLRIKGVATIGINDIERGKYSLIP